VSTGLSKQPDGPLCDRIVALAGRADDHGDIGADLVEIAVMSADRVAGVSYASVTSRYEGAYATVAASSALAAAVDQAQYADDAGPCLEALDGAYPAAVPDIAATMTWRGFRDVACGLGLSASLSIPLFAGRGIPIAALNLYTHDPAGMKNLTEAVWSVFEGGTAPERGSSALDAGGAEFVAGLAGAFTVRANIQQAIGVLLALTEYTLDEAFTALRLHAAEARLTLPEAARSILAGRGGEYPPDE
jgi:hypothetical protein